MGLPSSSDRDARLEAAGLERLAYSQVEAADMLGVSPYQVACLVRAGKLPHKRLGKRIVIPARALTAWLEDSDVWSPDAEAASPKA